MLLDLNKIHAPRERYEKVYAPEAFSADGEAFRVVAPVSLAFDIVKDKRHFQLVGTVTTAGAAVQPVPGAVHVAGGQPIRPAVSAARARGRFGP